MTNIWLMRLVACLIAVVVYVWGASRVAFRPPQLAAFILGIGVLSASCACSGAARAPSNRQPIAGTLRFTVTLEIYAIELAASSSAQKCCLILPPADACIRRDGLRYRPAANDACDQSPRFRRLLVLLFRDFPFECAANQRIDAVLDIGLLVEQLDVGRHAFAFVADHVG